jgi:hypothetical protein
MEAARNAESVYDDLPALAHALVNAEPGDIVLVCDGR